MLDEMAIETQQEKGRHKEELSNLRLQHEKEVLAVRARYERELRELHEHKKRQEDELRGQLKEEKVLDRKMKWKLGLPVELHMFKSYRRFFPP